MTLKGAITELQLLLKANDMPIYYKPCIEKVIETIQMEWTYQMSRLDEMERRIELHEKAMAKAMRDTADTPQTERDAYWKELFEAVVKGEMSDASANQAWYEYINKQDTPQTESTGSPIGDYRDGVGAWQTDCPWK